MVDLGPTQAITFLDRLVDNFEVTYDAGGVTTVRQRCQHNKRIPVESCVTGEILAYICEECEEQLDGDT